MSDGVQFKATVEITAPSEQIMTDFAISHLKERGYSVAAPGAKWEKPQEFLERIGISHMTLSRKFKDHNCPNVLTQRGAQGRLVMIASNPDFDRFCRQNK